jgi:hypothetical protein
VPWRRNAWSFIIKVKKFIHAKLRTICVLWTGCIMGWLVIVKSKKLKKTLEGWDERGGGGR